MTLSVLGPSFTTGHILQAILVRCNDSREAAPECSLGLSAPRTPTTLSSSPSREAAQEYRHGCRPNEHSHRLIHGHKRSNVESTFTMIRSKHGDSLHSDGKPAMRNEILAKLVCHDLCCLTSAMYEMGINPVFWIGRRRGNGIRYSRRK
jgi:hypothetical protein